MFGTSHNLKCLICEHPLYVSEHFFFDTDGIYFGCQFCHYGNMLGSSEPPVTWDPDDEDSVNAAKAILHERARKLIGAKRNPA